MSDTTSVSTDPAAPDPATPQNGLTQEQADAVARLTRDIPMPKTVSPGEIAGLGQEALDGYAYGERTRYDTQGRKWVFLRTAQDDQFRMTVAVSFFGIPLGDGAVALDRIAGSDGENELLALVEALAERIGPVQAACVAAQAAARSEADQAVAPLVEPTPDAGS